MRIATTEDVVFREVEGCSVVRQGAVVKAATRVFCYEANDEYKSDSDWSQQPRQTL